MYRNKNLLILVPVMLAGLSQLQAEDVPTTAEDAWSHAKRMVLSNDSTDRATGWFEGYVTAKTGHFAPNDWLVVVNHRLCRFRSKDESAKYSILELPNRTKSFSAHSIVGSKKIFHADSLVFAIENERTLLSRKDGTILSRDVDFDRMEANVIYVMVIEKADMQFIIARSRRIEDPYFLGKVNPNNDGFSWIKRGLGSKLASLNKNANSGILVDTNESDDNYLGLDFKLSNSELLVYGWSRGQAFLDGFKIANGEEVLHLVAE